MALTAQFVDGQLLQQSQQAASTQSAKAKEGTNAERGSSEMDKDAFLQLLVAQMKYQDPLEPTSNTEYISQYATFSELEQMQNMSGNLTLSRASETVGKEVIIEAKLESGETKTVQGYVEKVVYNGCCSSTRRFLLRKQGPQGIGPLLFPDRQHPGRGGGDCRKARRRV